MDEYSSGLHSLTRNITGSRAAAKASWLRISDSKIGHMYWNHSFWKAVELYRSIKLHVHNIYLETTILYDTYWYQSKTCGIRGKTSVKVVRKNWAFSLGSLEWIPSRYCNAWTAGSLEIRLDDILVCRLLKYYIIFLLFVFIGNLILIFFY